MIIAMLVYYIALLHGSPTGVRPAPVRESDVRLPSDDVAEQDLQVLALGEAGRQRVVGRRAAPLEDAHLRGPPAWRRRRRCARRSRRRRSASTSRSPAPRPAPPPPAPARSGARSPCARRPDPCARARTWAGRSTSRSNERGVAVSRKRNTSASTASMRDAVRGGVGRDARDRARRAVDRGHRRGAAARRLQPEAARVGVAVQHARAARQRADAHPRLALVDEHAGLLSGRAARPPARMPSSRHADRRRATDRARRATRRRILPARRRRPATTRRSSSRPARPRARRRSRPLRCDDPQRGDLRHRRVVVDVDHQAGQVVALAVDQAVDRSCARTAAPAARAAPAPRAMRARKNAASTGSSARVHSRTGICERGL